MKTVQLFCVPQNKLAEAELSQSKGEIIAMWTWEENGEPKSHFIKLHGRKDDGATVTSEDINNWIELHNSTNKPVVLVAEQTAHEKALEELLQ